MENQINVRVEPELRARLEELARAEDRTLSGQVRHLLAAAARREPLPRSEDRAAAFVVGIVVAAASLL
jgi:predicted transcriptional regulator